MNLCLEGTLPLRMATSLSCFGPTVRPILILTCTMSKCQLESPVNLTVRKSFLVKSWNVSVQCVYNCSIVLGDLVCLFQPKMSSQTIQCKYRPPREGRCKLGPPPPNTGPGCSCGLIQAEEAGLGEAGTVTGSDRDLAGGRGLSSRE